MWNRWLVFMFFLSKTLNYIFCKLLLHLKILNNWKQKWQKVNILPCCNTVLFPEIFGYTDHVKIASIRKLVTLLHKSFKRHMAHHNFSIVSRNSVYLLGYLPDVCSWKFRSLTCFFCLSTNAQDITASPVYSEGQYAKISLRIWRGSMSVCLFFKRGRP